jgi:ribosomal protein S18 acetylase RimI-like enzyme
VNSTDAPAPAAFATDGFGQAVAVDLRWASAGDEDLVADAGHLFDAVPQAEGIRRFLSTPGHHLCIAMIDGVPVGFVSGVETTHPDKGTEMFVYELAVDEGSRRQGIGRALVAALRDRARELGCYGMWVLTDADNTAAVKTYASGGAAPPSTHVMFDWGL